MKIYELTGLPGSGKSHLLENYTSNNIEVIDEKKFYDLCGKIRKSDKIKKVLALCFFYLDVILYLYIFSKKTCKSIKKSFKTTNSVIKFIALYDNVISLKKNKEKIVFDQGIIQNIWSISLLKNEKIEKDHLLKHIILRLEKKYDLFCIYYIIDYKLAAKRAITREKKTFTDYFEYEELCELYYNHCDDYKILGKYIDESKFKVITNENELDKVLKS